MKKEGEKLRELLEAQGITGVELSNKLGLSKNTAYYYFSKNKLKRSFLEKILKAFNIPMENFYTNTVEEVEPAYEISTHQGRNLQTYLDNHGIGVTHLSKQLNISRPTLYTYFNEKELPLGVLLELSKVLNVSVALLKGRGEGEKSFEKDIYLELKSINEKLSVLFRHLKITNGGG